jgi:ATP-binding cassette subfamily F protein 3
MGFENAYHQNVATLSGGEKTRLNLCKLLLQAPDLLILDEPTNHLDVKTLFWLEDYLTSYKGAILLVSHDRYFLDKTIRTIFEIENKRLSVFKGNYTKYKTLKAEKTAFLLKEYEKQQEERAHLQDFVDRNLYKASKAKSA